MGKGRGGQGRGGEGRGGKGVRSIGLLVKEGAEILFGKGWGSEGLRPVSRFCVCCFMGCVFVGNACIEVRDVRESETLLALHLYSSFPVDAKDAIECTTWCVVSCTVRWVHSLPFLLLLLLLAQPFQRLLYLSRSQYQKYLPQPRKTNDSPAKPPQLLHFHHFVVHTILVFFRNSL